MKRLLSLVLVGLMLLSLCACAKEEEKVDYNALLNNPELTYSAEELAKMKSITVDSALNKPESLPVPILNSLIDEAINDGKWTAEDAEIYKGLDQKQRKNFPNFISKEAMATLAEIAVSDPAAFTALTEKAKAALN